MIFVKTTIGYFWLKSKMIHSRYHILPFISFTVIHLKIIFGKTCYLHQKADITTIIMLWSHKVSFSGKSSFKLNFLFIYFLS